MKKKKKEKKTIVKVSFAQDAGKMTSHDDLKKGNMVKKYAWPVTHHSQPCSATTKHGKTSGMERIEGQRRIPWTNISIYLQ